ncbi:MAG TPA: TonB-dependent receptor [Steroidobacteraceae bacterium]|nr:TonB-dependent receptor [Steroidobacteraceae bacterium]
MARIASLSTAALVLAGSATAAEEHSTPELETVEVSETRLRSVADIDVPASVSTVQMDADSNRTQTNVTELLSGIPGVTALDRQNYAQDTQLSVRGFGARATFGVRGVRIYADGIPATMPDGQGQLSHFNLMGADRLQIMRGPFSALYGNSSGGVVQLWSRPGTDETSARLRSTYGSFDTRSYGAQTLGTLGPVDYNLGLSRFQTDGYRDHSAARRDSVNARVGIDVGPSRQLVLVANYLDIPEAQDTLGLTPGDWRADPQQAASVATQFNTRKSVNQKQGGVVFEQKLGDHTLHFMGYTGSRQVTQYQAIPTLTQRNPAVASSQLHSGGVVDLSGDYRGGDARWSWASSLGGRPFEFTLGTNYDRQNQQRRGYENFLGSPSAPTALGVRGNLRRNEDNKVDNFDQFAQAWWQFADRWSVLAGVRHSEVNFESVDHYIVGINPDDSGHKRYADTTSVGGLMFHATDSLRLYASVGEGFETPTFNELSYRADAQAGLAFNLLDATSKDYEIGAKWRAGGVEWDSAVFRANTANELTVARNSGGRSSYRNIAAARRQGFESSLAVPLAQDWRIEASYTLLNAEFRSSYQTCVATPCTTANVTVPAGSAIPGVPKHQGQLRLQWTPGPWSAALELDASSHIVVNDVGTVAAPGYGLIHAELGRKWDLGASTLRGFARVENLLDKTYVGSVIVNEGNSRFFESGPERSAMVGLQWQWR